MKEYYDNGKLRFEGEYFNGERNGKGTEYFYKAGYRRTTRLKFSGDYLNGKRWNGKGKEFEYDRLIYEGEYLNGNRNGYIKEYDKSDGRLIIKGEYLNGVKNGNIKEYDGLF